jgi:hypothetical protein
MNRVLGVVSNCKKPVIINFLGGDPEIIKRTGAVFASTLEEAALQAVSRIKGLPLPEALCASRREDVASMANAEKKRLAPRQKYIRGVFCGGTHCEEAALILKGHVTQLYANVPLPACTPLDTVHSSCKHTLIDLGDETFTRGRPHPVIDPAPVKERLLKEGSDPEVAVVLLDVILGYGVHPDPAGALTEAIAGVKEKASREGRHVAIVASVCGSGKDPQNLISQENKLKQSGVLVMPSNAQAALMGALILS